MSMNKHLFPLLLISCFCIFPLYAGIERYADDMFPDTDNDALGWRLILEILPCLPRKEPNYC